MTDVGEAIGPDCLDLLTELFNIGVGRASASLSALIESRIELSVPTLRIARFQDIGAVQLTGVDAAATLVVQEFQGVIRGRSVLAFPGQSGLTLASVLAGMDLVESELDVELQGVLLEVGNIVLNSVMGTFANAANLALGYSLPALYEGASSLRGMFLEATAAEEDLVIADVRFQVLDRQICGSILVVFGGGSLLEVVRRIEPGFIA